MYRAAFLAAGIALAAAPAVAQTLPGSVALDNTGGGSSSLTSSSVSLSNAGARRRAVVFTTPGQQVELTGFRFGFQKVGGASPSSYDLHIDLMAVGPTNNPTGPTLASVLRTVNVTTTPAYQTFNLTGTGFDNYALSSFTKYGVVLYTTGGDGTAGLAWNESSGGLPAGSNGFSYTDLQLSSNSGSSWIPSTGVESSVQINFLPVPEPAGVLAVGAVGLGLARAVRRRTARARPTPAPPPPPESG